MIDLYTYLSWVGFLVSYSLQLFLFFRFCQDVSGRFGGDMVPFKVRKKNLRKDRLKEKKPRKEVTMHHAASCGNLVKIETLLKKGVHVDAQDACGDTALQRAIECGNFECVKLLVNKGANVNLKRKDGYSPLHMAAAFGLSDYIMYLLESGADVNAATMSDLTPLHLAVRSCNPECVKVLLKYGAPINAKNKSGRTALHMAVSNSESCIDILIQEGANLFLKDDFDVCPLEMAIELGVEWLKKLLPWKIDKTDLHGTTALHLASKCVNYQCLQYLIEIGCDVNIQNSSGDTPLHFACTSIRGKWHNSIMPVQFAEFPNFEILVKAGASIHQKNKLGLAPIHVSTKFDFLLSLLYIHKFEGDLNLLGGEKDYMPIHFAAEAGNLKCLEYLIMNNVDKTCADSENCTALMIAARNCHFTCVKFLLQAEVPLWTFD